jgi:regulatory protein YycI of two-component signal transduction system YycFG
MLSLINEGLEVKSSNPYRGSNNQRVCHTMSLPFTLKNILRQKQNYVNSNIFTMQKYNLQKIKKPKSFKIL